MSRKRRRWSADDKLRIVLAGLQGDIEMSELCRREGINPTQSYGWQKQVMGSASKIFGSGSSKLHPKAQRLEADLRRAKDAIADIATENLAPPKGLWA